MYRMKNRPTGLVYLSRLQISYVPSLQMVLKSHQSPIFCFVNTWNFWHTQVRHLDGVCDLSFRMDDLCWNPMHLDSNVANNIVFQFSFAEKSFHLKMFGFFPLMSPSRIVCQFSCISTRLAFSDGEFLGVRKPSTLSLLILNHCIYVILHWNPWITLIMASSNFLLAMAGLRAASNGRLMSCQKTECCLGLCSLSVLS